MARRTSWRIPIRMNVRCCIGNNVSSGTVTNLSENGMFIDTEETCFSEDSQFEVTISLKKEDMRLSVKIIRSVKINSHFGMGVEILNPPQKYTDFVENLLFVL